MKIPAGYKLAVISPNGEIIETLEISGYDLEKPFARAEVLGDIEQIVTLHFSTRKV